MTVSFTKRFRAEPEHIDELGHVNNAVWVRWVQDMATMHWNEACRESDREAFVWVVVRHEIDFRGNIGPHEHATGETWIEGPPKGAKSVRLVRFSDSEGKPLVEARTTWAMLDRMTKRPARVTPDIIAPFLAPA